MRFPFSSGAARRTRGFTIVEMLVVISIIVFISSMILATIQEQRKRSYDAQKKIDFARIDYALNLFYDERGKMPANYNEPFGGCENDGGYQKSMQELVDGGFLSTIPKSPDGTKYCYYDYGTGNDKGALLETILTTGPLTAEGEYPSCRPYAEGVNWCDQSATYRWYCICHPY